MKLLDFEKIKDHVKWLSFVQRRGKGGAKAGQRRGKGGAKAGQKAGFRVMLKYFEAKPRVPLFCSYHILTSSVIYY